MCKCQSIKIEGDIVDPPPIRYFAGLRVLLAVGTHASMRTIQPLLIDWPDAAAELPMTFPADLLILFICCGESS